MRVCAEARRNADCRTANDGNAQANAELVSVAYSNARTEKMNTSILGENRNDCEGISSRH